MIVLEPISLGGDTVIPGADRRQDDRNDKRNCRDDANRAV
jgi:hypothetical protein